MKIQTLKEKKQVHFYYLRFKEMTKFKHQFLILKKSESLTNKNESIYKQL